MEETRRIYIMISRTDTGIARLIRGISRYPYNHVSLTLDPTLRQWYSFARYVQDAPFYSGFIREPAERFLAGGTDAQVRIFRLELPVSQAADLEQFCQTAGREDNGLIYNLFDAVASGIGLKLPIPGSHTCLSFACSILGREHRTIQSLSAELAPYCVYEGSLAALVPDSGSRDDVYFTRIGLLGGTVKSAKQFGRLLLRLLRSRFSSLMFLRFHRTVH